MDRCIILHYVRNTFVYCIALYVCHRLSLLGLPMPEHHSSTLSPDEGKMSNAADDHASAAPGRDDDQAPETAVVNKVGSFRHALYTADQLDGVDPWR